ncbi:MAG: hypothetical protein K2N90_09505 [Lachnospiraceae bacterium]|nr:hypothetical protein [Lachnospiraceae bacterium]
MKKIILSFFALLFVFLCIPAFHANAAEDNAVWVDAGNMTWTLNRDDGTNITVKLIGNVLHVQGTGAIPSYSPEALGLRPWHVANISIYEILVYDGITEIGSRAFSDMNYLKKVTLSANVFLKDGTVFAGAREGCRFTFLGTNMATEMIGDKIPYTSLDSIVHFALANNNGMYYYIFANHYMKRMVDLKSGNKLVNVVASDDFDNTANVNYPYIDITTKVQKVSGDLHYLTAISTQSNIQGRNALEIFALVMGDNQYAGAYNVSLNLNDKIIKTTDTPVTYSMEIPNAYQSPNRQFSLIQLGAGTVNTLVDEDTDDNTITFTTDYPSTVYALVYHDIQ